ncbi:MAG: RluA family pseudouridine synthase [Bacteroidales bacterium]|nr:RluA family pseudouridine synthase [Bacteroidales bacterium]
MSEKYIKSQQTIVTQFDNNDLYEHYKIIVDKGQTPIRIDKFLTERLNFVSRNKIQQAANAGCIIVNGKPVKNNYKIKPYDEIKVVLPYPPENFELVPENIPLNIVYEDEDIIVINKQKNLVVHPAPGHPRGTLLNGLLYYFENTSQKHIKPLLVHRLDKDTTGLLVICKTEYAQVFIAKQLSEHSIERKYRAVVWGIPEPTEGKIVGHIGRALYDRTKMVCYPDGSHGKYAVTHYKVLKHWYYVSLVECRLETGRTNQIRAHFDYINHPLFGDSRYGGHKILKGSSSAKFNRVAHKCLEICNRPALHAQTLGFIHPRTNKLVIFTTALANDIKEIIKIFDTELCD